MDHIKRDGWIEHEIINPQTHHKKIMKKNNLFLSTADENISCHVNVHESGDKASCILYLAVKMQHQYYVPEQYTRQKEKSRHQQFFF